MKLNVLVANSSIPGEVKSMINVIPFKPNEGKTARDNINSYVIYYKNIMSTNEIISSWESLSWGGIYRFTKFNFKHNRDAKLPLDDRFIAFAKAYIKSSILYGKRKEHTQALRVLKVIEFVLLELNGNADINGCNNTILDKCASVINDKYAKSVSAKMCKELENIVVFLKTNKMIDLTYLNWVNPVRFKVQKNWDGYNKDLEGHSKLPDIKSILSLASIFSKKDEELSQRDLFTTSVVALLCCAPSRISEILALPEDCECWVEDSKGIQRYGLRFYAAKGYAGDIKWIPTEMIPVAQKAINRLKTLSKSSRELAIQMEAGYGKFHSKILSTVTDENKLLTVAEVCQFLGFYREKSTDYHRKINSITLNNKRLKHRNFSYTLKELKKLIYDSKPKDFPWYDHEKNIKYSNALCLLNRFQINEVNDTYKLVFERPTYNLFITDIVKSRDTEDRFVNIFERHGYLNKSGRAYRLNSHQPRHLLNTLALVSGMDGFDVARWSGRQCISQNQYYDHRNHAHMLTSMRKNNILKPKEKKQSQYAGGNSFNLNEIKNGAVMISKHGYCKHAYVSEPCAYYPHNESGEDDQNLASIHKKIRDKACFDKEDGYESAQKWCEFHERIKVKEV